MVEDFQEPISQLKENILSVWGRLDVDDINKKIAEKEALSNAPGFWDDNVKATKVMNDIKLLKGRIEPWQKLVADIDDIETMYQMALEENDQALESELKEMYETASKDYEHYSILNLLSDEVDKNDCFLSVHGGAGGTEACDWTFMLSRMYQRWAERHGYKVEVVSQEEAEGGLKSINMRISGDYVYGYTKGEAGVHRLVRISPFDAKAIQRVVSPIKNSLPEGTSPSFSHCPIIVLLAHTVNVVTEYSPARIRGINLAPKFL